jgi:S1-C subfamily serine protease
VGATLVGRDPWHDIAVLKIEGEDLPEPLPLGDSRALQVGQTVLAIGNPFGLDWTLTTGIVSALDRELPGEEGRGQGGLIQTDAAINPGNSGGPLLDSAGRVIGVNSSIYSPSGTNAGIGFAVPSGTLERVVPQLISQGFFAPPSLGIRWDWRVNAAMNRRGLPGVMVLDVAPGSDAAEVGLEPARISAAGQVLLGHVVTAIDGIPVTTVEEMLAVLDDHLPGDTVEVTFEKRNEKIVRELRLIPGDPAGIER